MLSYIIRRLLLMIPTLFGITLISFYIMQKAPGDPQINQLSGGSAGQSTQTREAYLIQKRELHLDKPLILNLDYFRDYAAKVRSAAHYRARTVAQIFAEMKPLSTAEPAAANAGGPDVAERLAFLRSLEIPDFDQRLTNAEAWDLLAQSIDFYAKVFCEDVGSLGVPPVMELLQDEHADLKTRIGAIRCLSSMVPEPFRYTYSVDPAPAETAEVTGAWRLWWQRKQNSFEAVDAEARKFLAAKLAEMVGAADDKTLNAAIDAIGNSEFNDVAPRFFAEKLLDRHTPLSEQAAAALFLKQFYNAPLQLDVPVDAPPALVQEVAANWLEYYQLNEAKYHPGLPLRLVRVLTDTQYAYMVTRLVTFQFGQSALRTREPVNEKIWHALIVSAPLIFCSELLIYALAIPIGVVCGVYRGRPLDRGISLGLFLLNSIPGFVAAMLCLVFFCYGDYLRLFPLQGLHSDGAEHMSFLPYLADYAWHAALPVVCLSLFSLAAIAMYARSSMLDVINQDFIRTARAKGLPGHKVILKHALRNALIPLLTLFSTFLPAMLGGAVLIERLFDIPGIGRLNINSIEQKDFPTLMALLYVEAIVVMVSILLTDLLYVLVDPRISFSGRGKSA